MIGNPGTPGFFSRDPRAVAALQALASGGLGPNDVAANHGGLDANPIALAREGQDYDARRRAAFYQNALSSETDPNRQQQLRIEQQGANMRAAAQPDWSAFFGRMGAEGDEANQAGYDFKADIGSGRPRPTRNVSSGARSLLAIG